MMEINELFGKKDGDKPAPDRGSSEHFVSLVDDLVFAVWIYGIRHGFIKHDLRIEYTDLSGSARLLRDGITDMGILSSIELARIRESMHIAPGLAISTTGAAGMAQLFFKRGLKDINRVAVRSTANTSLVLLKILLREKYASDPEYYVSDAGMDEMLKQADAALITGCEAINLSQLYQNRLDLGEEWYDLTGLPFVFSILAGRKFVMGRNEIAPILKSFELGKKNLEKIARQFAGKDNVPWTPYHDFISRQINYRFSELDQDGLNEFYNYAFFFGYIDQIPDINLIN
jgi:chorismate dehydratase